MTQCLLSLFKLLLTTLTPLRPILITLLQVIMQLLPITDLRFAPNLIILLNKLATPPFYAKLKTDSDAEFYKESKYAKTYSVFHLKKHFCPALTQLPVESKVFLCCTPNDSDQLFY